MKKLLLLSLVAFAACSTPSVKWVNQYSVTWDSPSHDPSGSMPIGNGEVGANVWVEENGDLLFYISRTDSWSEIATLMKLGRIRISLSPNPFLKGNPFSQQLNLQEGCITIQGGEKGRMIDLKLFINSDSPVIYLSGKSESPVTATVTAEIWRDREREIPRGEVGSSMAGYPDSIHFMEYPDVVTGDQKMMVFHRNAYSEYPLIIGHQKLQLAPESWNDPLENRTFGYAVWGEGFERTSSTSLTTEEERYSFQIKIATHTAQTATPEEWIDQTEQILKDAPNTEKAAARTGAWWSDFWAKSYLRISTPDDSTGHRITQSYLLQRWITAAGGRGNYPIKFNGSIFTVDPEYTESAHARPDEFRGFPPDFRRWGGCYWWQNTRLMYHPLLQSGNFEMVDVLFDFYIRNLPMMRSSAKTFYGAEGALLPETGTIFSTYTNKDYGWERQGAPDSVVLNRYIRYCWNSGIELVDLMCDYYRYTENKAFATTKLVPMAYEVLSFFESRFPKDEQGVLRITPTQAVETYWDSVCNDLPSVAGLHNVIRQLKQLPPEVSSEKDRELWSALECALPPIPTRMEEGVTLFAPAESYSPRRFNVENPELYAIFPFPLCNFTLPNCQMGIDTYHRRVVKNTVGWTQDGQQAARLGLTEEARDNILAKIENSNPNHRFPAIWGPNFDWTPDQDHGSNLLITLQEMVLQTYDSTVYLLPAFPKEWDVEFKLHTPSNNIVTGHYEAGAWKKAPKLLHSGKYNIQVCD